MAEKPLSAARQELLRRRLALQRAEAHRALGPAPLSFAQERFWFLDQLEPGSSEYHITVLARLRGPLRRDALRHALGQLAARHTALRTTFPAPNGVPEVRVDEPGPAPLEERSLRGAGELETLAREAHRRPFELHQGPLWRAVLVELGPNEFALILTLHHIITDGWSLGILFRDLAALYNGSTPAGTPTPFGYLARAERQRLTGPHLEALVAHWRQVLDGAPSAIELPLDRPLPPLASHAGATRRYPLSTKTTAAIQRLCGEWNTTPYQLLLALFAGFLGRIGRTRDLVLGTSYAGRDRPGSTTAVGVFVNTLPLRLALPRGGSLTELWSGARGVLRAAVEHSELPFEKLVQELAPARDPRRTPLFNVFFDLKVHHDVPHWEGLDVTEESLELGEAPFDLALSVDARGANFHAALQFKTALFDGATIDTLWRAFERFAAGATESPTRALDELPLVEAQQLRAQLAPAVPAVPFEAVHHTISSTAARTPEAAAVQSEAGVWTHAQLDQRASQLGRALQQWLGTERCGTPICSALERSPEAILVALAIWKAGACYVPLDPADPAARRERILATFDEPHVITSGASISLPANARRFDLSGFHFAEAAVEASLQAEVDPEDPAYVIFTSGSTGLPKGVLIPHRALANHVAWVRSAFAFTERDRFLLRTPLSFDASIWELVHPLVHGACLVVAPGETGRDGHALVGLAQAQRITVLQTVPSILRAWLDERRFDQLTHLRHLISAGESLPHGLADEVQARFRDAGLEVRIYNLYGPSEACIDATWEVLDGERPAAEAGGRESVPIGRPVHGTTAVVLDEGLEALPDGVAGELFLGGAGLALGYLRTPAETARRFVELDLGAGQQRWYRTGDDVRRLADGRFEALGRQDGQVKVRGFRVELGEIERALLEVDGVRQAAVLAVPSPAAGQRLVGFFVSDGTATEAELGAALAARLPDYMVPSTLVRLPILPLTASEKTDRKALTEHAKSVASEARPHGRPAATPTEEFLQAKLAELLGTPAPDVEADFFALGGHSLLATRLLAAAREHFQVELSLRGFLERPTLAELALEIESNRTQAEAPLPTRTPGAPIPLSRAQERLWILAQRTAGSVPYNMPGGLRLRGALDVIALTAALQAVVGRHAVLRTGFRELPPGGPWLAEQVVRSELEIPLVHESLPAGALPETWVRASLDAEARRVFDLESDPLLVLRLLRLAPDDHVLVLNLHHILGDGWSFGIFADELAALYAAARHAREAQLAPLGFQYADFAAWDRARPIDDAGVAAWVASLAGSPALSAPLALPTNRPRPERPSYRGDECSVRIPSDLTRALRELARAERVSQHTLLLAAFALFLGRITGADDLVVGAVVANRTRPETQVLIGLFVGALPIRLRPTRTKSLRAFLAEVRAAMELAIEHGENGLEVVIDALVASGSLERDERCAPLFQVGFDYDPDAGRALQLEGLEIAPVEYHGGTAKLDWNLRVEDYGSELVARVEYATDLFDAERVEQLLGAWVQLLRGLARNVSRPTGEVALITPEQRARWIDEAAGPALVVAMRPSFEALAEHARLTPARTALLAGERAYSYAALQRAAETFAEQLAQLKRPGPIALQLPRSFEQVAALFGIWRAGRAWLAIDAGEPLARRRELLAGAGAVAVVSHDTELAEACGLPGLAPPRGDDEGSLPTTTKSASPVPSDWQSGWESSDAYLVATSGSTGSPKVIAVGHGALANHHAGAAAFYGWTQDDVFLSRIPLTFDAALIELLTPLSLGATVVLTDETAARDPMQVLELAARHGVTVLVGVATWLEALLTEGERVAGLAALRQLISGGEIPGPRLRALWTALPRRPDFFNSYGPAEACIEAVAQRLEVHDLDPAGPTPPIGRALPGVRAYVLDEAGEPTLAGVEGELVLGGAGLARGYVAATAGDDARFRADLLAGAGRAYWTGDRASRRSDGALVFHGRRDRELKLGGRRLDPEEVESVLLGHADVRLAAVVPSPQHTLVAHLVLAREVPLDELRRFVQARLPKSLCPSEWRVHSELPQLSNGKLDLQRLQRAPLLGTRLVEADEPARDELEARLVRSFAAHLGLDSPGRNTDYFAAGGNSMGAIRLVTELREELGVPLRLADFFRTATPATLADWIRSGGTAEDRSATWARMRADAALDPGLVATAPSAGDAVLLTGATGFLGAFLLVELAQQFAEVRCLVRATDAATAERRTRDNLTRYGLTLPADIRLVAFAGDLEAPHFGLDPDAWQTLSAGLAAVVHNGAAVDFFRDYAALAAANVTSTRTAVELALATGAELNLISTIGVVARETSDPAPIQEGTPICLPGESAESGVCVPLEGGYEQTKWVAEELVREAGRRGLRVRIFRPGRIAASAVTSPGAGNAADFAGRFLVGCLELGAAPELDAAFDLTPVDHVARAVTQLLAEGPESAGTWHLLHPVPTPYRALFEAARARGHALEFVPLATWRARLAARPVADLAPIAALLDGLDDETAAQKLAPDAALAGVDSRRSFAKLAALGLTPPTIDAAYAAAAIAFLESGGHLPGDGRSGS